MIALKDASRDIDSLDQTRKRCTKSTQYTKRAWDTKEDKDKDLVEFRSMEDSFVMIGWKKLGRETWESCRFSNKASPSAKARDRTSPPRCV